MFVFASVALGLLSMVGFALANVTSQPLSRRLGSTQTLFLRQLTSVSLFALLTIPSAHYYHNVHEVVFCILLGMFGYLPLLSFTHGIKISRIGIVAPIAGCSPLIILVLASNIMHTPITPIAWLGAFLVVVANIGASINFTSLKESKITNLASGVPFGLLAALGWGVFLFILIYPTRVIGPWLTAFLTELGIGCAAGIHLLLNRPSVPFREALNPKIMLNGLFLALGTAAFAVGVSKYSVSIVGALGNSTALLASLLAVVFFKERLSHVETIGAATMILGVILLTLP